MIAARLVCLALVGLMVERLHSTNAANCVYHVYVATGTGYLDGTNARVFVRLYGTLAVCPWREMKVPHGFRPKSTMHTSVTCPCLGRQRGLRISHDNSGSFPDWYVRGMAVQRYPGGFLYHYFDKFWLKKGSLSKWMDKSYCMYGVRTHTSDTRYAGSDTPVYIKLYGTQAITPWLRLKVPGNSFRRGKVVYSSVFARCVGYKKRIRIRHGDKPSRTYWGWHLFSLGIRHLAAPTKPKIIYNYDYCYPHRWMPHESEYATHTKYKIAVYTGSQPGAGTDANVKIWLHGTITYTILTLKNPKKDDFERGSIDGFYLEGRVVGSVKRIYVRHDGSGSGPWWYVKRIYVRVRATFELFKCPCNKWLTTSKPYTYCGCYQVE